MPSAAASSPSASPSASPSTGTVVNADGTAVRVWTNGAEGVPLVVSNGLGSVPCAWPALADPGRGYRAPSSRGAPTC